jgi:hypothetical protein
MTKFVDMKPGKWALAFFQPYGPYSHSMQEHLEMFARRGGGWDSHRATEIFLIHQIEAVKPKTYTAIGSSSRVRAGERLARTHVIAAVDTEAEAIALRDRFFAIGVDADDRIEAEMYRRIAKFETRETAKAVKRVHRCLPHIFGRDT